MATKISSMEREGTRFWTVMSRCRELCCVVPEQSVWVTPGEDELTLSSELNVPRILVPSYVWSGDDQPLKTVTDDDCRPWRAAARATGKQVLRRSNCMLSRSWMIRDELLVREAC
jgi:hypothetical protein